MVENAGNAVVYIPLVNKVSQEKAAEGRRTPGRSALSDVCRIREASSRMRLSSALWVATRDVKFG